MKIQPTRVLLVEDHPADVRLLQEALREIPGHGLDLSISRTLAEALVELERHRFDVVLLDLSLPDADGLEALDSTRRKAPGVPTVVLTGRDDSDLAVAAVRAGAQDYLVKGRLQGELLVRSLRYAIERKKSLELLELRERRFRTLIEKCTDLIAVIDEEWRIKFASSSVSGIVGLSAEELTRCSFISLIHPEDVPVLLAGAARSNEACFHGPELRIRGRDGGWRILETNWQDLRDDDAVRGLVLNAHDITERKQWAERLSNAHDRLTAVIENAPVAVIELNAHGVIESWSLSAERIFGWKRDAAEGKPLAAVTGDIPDLRRAIGAQSEAGSQQVDVRCRNAGGDEVELQIWLAPLRRDSESGAILLIAADITERKRIEEQFLHAQKMEAVGQLAGGIVHDFNNLLTVILGYTQLALHRLNPDEAACRELGEVIAAGERASSLTRQLLVLSRRQPVRTELVDLNSTIRGVSSMIRSLLGETVELEMDLAEDLHPVLVDRNQMELVLLNLATNARDAIRGEGKVEIRTFASDRNEAVVTFADTGMGIPSELQARIFEPFFTTKDPGKGTGLGLSTCRSIIRQHGGDMSFRSRPGAGTAFEIRLPFSSGRVPRPVESVLRERDPGPVPATIVLTEDHPEVRRVMRESLVSGGYQVLVTASAREGAAIVRDFPEPIHLLIADVVLREGTELAVEFQKRRPGAPVLLISGYVGPGAELSCLSPPPTFLTKPFAPETLLSKVADTLAQHRRTVNR